MYFLKHSVTCRHSHGRAICIQSDFVKIVRARWFDIISRSIELSTRSATLSSMRQLYLMAEVGRLRRRANIKVRIVAIPDDWSPPMPGTFVKETMNNLADMGERMGGDPTIWRTSPP